jgi:uncharacterized protein YcsI (UPF0317 family)
MGQSIGKKWQTKFLQLLHKENYAQPLQQSAQPGQPHTFLNKKRQIS